MQYIKIEIEILEKLYQIIIITKEVVISAIKTKINNNDLEEDLKVIVNDFNKFLYAINGMLKTRKKYVKDLSIEEKIATHISVSLNIKKQNSINSVASMLKQEMLLDIEEITNMMLEYSKLSKTILNLYNRILSANKRSVHLLEKYI